MSPRPSVENERRQQILEAAMTCFSRNGYHQTTMDDIAAQLPFSKGLLYYYFNTKRALFLAILDSWIDRSLATWDSLVVAEEDTDALMHACLGYGVKLLSESTDLARVEFEFYGELGRDPVVSDAFRDLFGEFRARITAILESGIQKGELRPMDTGAVAAMLLGVYEGLAMQAMVEPDGLDWSRVADALYAVVMRGIEAEGKGDK